jgi:hypothetical protein
MPCGTKYLQQDQPILIADIGLLKGGQVFSPNSIGEEIRLAVKRNGVTIGLSSERVNAPNIAIDIPGNVTLQNGDVLCMQVSNNQFGYYQEACKTIPTPRFNLIRPFDGNTLGVYFSGAMPLTPNCEAGDTISLFVTLFNQEDNQANVMLSGTRNAFQNTSESFPILIDETPGFRNHSTPFGNIGITYSTDGQYHLSRNAKIEIQVTDCHGWSSVNSECGHTNLIITQNGDNVLTQVGALIFFQYQPIQP